MKWFKHMSNSRRDPFIQELEMKFQNGYGLWFKLIEIMAENEAQKKGGELTVHVSVMCRELTAKRSTVTSLLSTCELAGRLTHSFEGQKVTIKMPKLLDIKDNYTKDLQGPCKKLVPHIEEIRRDKEENKRGNPPPLLETDFGKPAEADKGKASPALNPAPSAPPPSVIRVPELIAQAWNRTFEGVCPMVSLPLSQERVNLVTSRLGRYPPNPDFWETLFKKIRNDERLWRWKDGRTVHFNWIFGSDSRVEELIEGLNAPVSVNGGRRAVGQGKIGGGKYAALDGRLSQ